MSLFTPDEISMATTSGPPTQKNANRTRRPKKQVTSPMIRPVTYTRYFVLPSEKRRGVELRRAREGLPCTRARPRSYNAAGSRDCRPACSSCVRRAERRSRNARGRAGAQRGSTNRRCLASASARDRRYGRVSVRADSSSAMKSMIEPRGQRAASLQARSLGRRAIVAPPNGTTHVDPVDLSPRWRSTRLNSRIHNATLDGPLAALSTTAQRRVRLSGFTARMNENRTC